MLFPKIKEGARKIQEVILFGRYLVLSELGRASGSIVYLARHQKLGEYRVIKRIVKDSGSAWKVREAEILNHLKHPGIPDIYDMEEDEEAFYIIEEYIRGESLEALMLQSSFITPDFIYHTIMEVADILNYMHHLKQGPVIYQDLKSEHVIISENGINLIDFGIASCPFESGNKFQNYGTPEFCAPEKLNNARVSVQTDIYSIGKLLEKLVYAEGTKESQYLMHIAEKAMKPDLSERYASVKAFQEDLEKHMQSKGSSVNEKHLLKKIIIAGSQSRIGTTHLSIAFTEYLNRQNIFAVYQEKNSSNHMRKFIFKNGFTKEGGLYRRGNFWGMPAYGKGIEINIPETAVEILDYGSNLEKALSEKADMFLFIIGSREWETEYSDLSYEKLKDKKELTVLTNYGAGKQAKKYAKKYKRSVYCFPLDENPFIMTKEKERLFEGLLEKEGKTNQKHWNCRKYPWMRSNALVRSIVKLCRKRTGGKHSVS